MKKTDLDIVKALAEIMCGNGLTKLSVKDGDEEISLERSSASAPIQSAAAPEKSAAPAAPSAPEIKGGTGVKSPMVGVFYAAPSPEDKPFVQLGDRVHKGDVLCIVEAMKLMNEITAEQDGTVAEICVEDGALVEFGQTLFILK